jgi:hypothetical protein
LTIVRLLVPLGLCGAIAATIAGATAAHGAVAVGCATSAMIAGFSAEFGRVFVQVSAYGDETRLPLRLPVPMVLPLVLAWLAVAGTLSVGVVLLGLHRWIFGAVLARRLAPSFHRFSRRWLVFVPAGIVIHDQLVLAETAMVLKSALTGVGLAPVDSDAADLTGQTSGARIELHLATSETFVFAADKKHHPHGRAIHATAVLISPSRPGRAMAEAARRTLPIAFP